MWLIVFSVVVVAFGFVLLFGAPYVPTLKKQQQDALKLLNLKPGQTLIELGSGDGRMLLAAAKQGLTVVGYELNPILYVISRVITFKYRKQIRVHFGNFWAKEWPPTDGVYVFLLAKYMKKLDKKVIQQYKNKNIKLVSYAFTVPGKTPVQTKGALYLYEY